MDKIKCARTRRGSSASHLVVCGMALAWIALTTSCGFTLPDWFNTDPMNGVNPPPRRGPVVTITSPSSLSDGTNATWVATWLAGTGPYQVSWDFGGGADNIGFAESSSPDTQIVDMVNITESEATYTYTVSVVDADGFVGVATGTYIVTPTS